MATHPLSMPGSVRQCMHAAELVGSPGMFCLMDFSHLVGRKTKAQNGEKFNKYVNMFHCHIYDRNIQKEHLWPYIDVWPKMDHSHVVV